MKDLKKYVIIVVAITLIGELYFYPFHGSFRFSAGVVAFSLILLLIDEISMIRLALYTGLAVFIFRSAIQYTLTEVGLTAVFFENYPASLYYILFGILAGFFTLHKNRANPYLTLATLFTIDVLCNLTEAMIRSTLDSYLFKFIIIIGLIRSIASYGIFMLIENQNNIIRKKEHQKRYIQLNTLVSAIQAELFYLKKSTADIETVMDKSYSLYTSTRNDERVSNEALDIAKEVHEIKKDYYRVLSGFESFLKDFETSETMSLKDLAFIMESNGRRYIEENEKDITLRVIIGDNMQVKKYYSLFTVLNNLIVNSIDAINGKGLITVEQTIQDESVQFSILDNGGGIDNNVLPYIFNPGFTTKYDKNTGSASTGIGLSHVQNIIDELHGEIGVRSSGGETKFSIMIPKASLLK